MSAPHVSLSEQEPIPNGFEVHGSGLLLPPEVSAKAPAYSDKLSTPDPHFPVPISEVDRYLNSDLPIVVSAIETLPEDPNTLPKLTGTKLRDHLALRGIRRWAHNRRLVKTHEKLVDKIEDTELNRTLAKVALTGAGYKLLPTEFQAEPDEEVPDQKSWRKKRHARKVDAISEELATVRKQRDLSDWARRRIEGKKRAEMELAEHWQIEEEREKARLNGEPIPEESLYKKRLDFYNDLRREDASETSVEGIEAKFATGTINAEERARKLEVFQLLSELRDNKRRYEAGKLEQPTYKGRAKEIEDRIAALTKAVAYDKYPLKQFDTHNHDTKYEKDTSRYERVLVNRLLQETEHGRKAKRRRKKIAKLKSRFNKLNS